jgi:hypothetical protein
MIIQVKRADGAVAVIVRLPAHLSARSINLVGDFNGWSTSATPMRLGASYWEAMVAVPVGATSYYAFLVDGVAWRSEYAGPQAAPSPQLSPFLPIEILQGANDTPRPAPVR